MRSHVNLTGRPLAAVVLAAFIVLPPVGAWLRMAADRTPPGSVALVKADATSSRGHLRHTKQGWPRKALVPKVVSVVPGVVAPRRPEDGQKLWSLIAAPAAPTQTRLELCPEFTKSDALCIQSCGTLQRHRPPPTAAL